MLNITYRKYVWLGKSKKALSMPAFHELEIESSDRNLHIDTEDLDDHDNIHYRMKYPKEKLLFYDYARFKGTMTVRNSAGDKVIIQTE